MLFSLVNYAVTRHQGINISAPAFENHNGRGPSGDGGTDKTTSTVSSFTSY